MEVIHNIKEIKNLSLALGFFDGVHLAHEKIIKRAVSEGQKNSLKSAVITFSTSPNSIIRKIEPVYLTTMEEKINLIENLGTDYLFILDFKKLVDIEAKDYINNVLIKYFSPKIVVTGFNHTFGKNGKGNSALLKKINLFNYIEIPMIKIDNEQVSSTNIKNKITNGNIEEANKMLGRNFSITGKIVKGNQIARTLGYKTANIIKDKNIVTPKYGVYFGYGEIDGKKYKALINFGIRPSVDKFLKETLEVHLFNFDEDIYGKNLKVEFVKRIREEKKFNSLEELKKQIDKDYNLIKNAICNF